MPKRPTRLNVPEKRLEQIESIQDAIRTLGEDYKRDSVEPNPLDEAIQRDLKMAADSLDLIKNFYKSKTEKKS